jgi:hypothetical protein
MVHRHLGPVPGAPSIQPEQWHEQSVERHDLLDARTGDPTEQGLQPAGLEPGPVARRSVDLAPERMERGDRTHDEAPGTGERDHCSKPTRWVVEMLDDIEEGDHVRPRQVRQNPETGQVLDDEACAGRPSRRPP